MNLLLCMNNCSGFYFISSVDFFSMQHHSNIAAAIYACSTQFKWNSIDLFSFDWKSWIGAVTVQYMWICYCLDRVFVWICLHFSNTSSKCVCQTVMIWPKGIVIGQVYNHLKLIAKIMAYFVIIQSLFRQLKQVNHMETIKIMEKFMEVI